MAIPGWKARFRISGRMTPGHLYFTLKDQNSQIRAVMFRSQARLLRFRPENGMQVVLRGRVTIYEDRGELQISAEYLEPKGAGALQVAFEQLKAKLEAEGLFDAARKKPIPTLPRRIGIVTSPQAAALRDILNILLRRHHTAGVLIFPAQVQGDSASAEVSAGIRYFNKARNVDVIIVARGGGSAEDLAAFNNEALARVVAASEIPVISAVGHETDFTIIDFVADLRAPTPSAAAELVIRSRQEVEDQAEGLRQRLVRAVRYRLLMGRQALTELAQHGAFGRMVDVINRRQQRLDDLKNRLDRAERQILEQHRRRLETAAAAVRHYDVRRMLAGIHQGTGFSRRCAGGNCADFVAAAARQAQSTYRAIGGAFSACHSRSRVCSGVRFRGSAVEGCGQVKPGDEISARLAKGIGDCDGEASRSSRVGRTPSPAALTGASD